MISPADGPGIGYGPELSTLEVVRISSPGIKIILFHFLQIFKIVLFVTSATINTVPSITRWNIESIRIRNPASINWFRILRAFLKIKFRTYSQNFEIFDKNFEISLDKKAKRYLKIL